MTKTKIKVAKLIAKIFLGLPLSGKSSLINSGNYSTGYSIVSADTFKETHENYDPERAWELHEWSVDMAERQMNIESDRKVNIIMDGGGINNSYTVRIIDMLKSKGYTIVLVHLKTPLEVCLARNEKRRRKVPREEIIGKAAKEITQYYKLSEICDKVEVIEYFTNKHIFIDMDGVVAALTTLPKVDGKIDFVNSEVFKHLKPVTPVINKLMDLNNNGHILYILSATPNSFSSAEKNVWLDENLPIISDRRHFVNSGAHKAEMLESLRIYYKLNKKDVLLIDDTHSTLYKVKDLCMKPMHPSEFLVHKFEPLKNE
jgi:predicted kinase